MRLAEEQIKQGILRSDPQVCFAAMNYFAQAFSRDTTVMPVVIEAFERFGCTDAFPFTFKIAELAQTPETIEWAISVFQQTDDKTEASRDFKHHLGQLLCNADLGRPGIERTCVNSRRTDHRFHPVRRLICCPVE